MSTTTLLNEHEPLKEGNVLIHIYQYRKFKEAL